MPSRSVKRYSRRKPRRTSRSKRSRRSNARSKSRRGSRVVYLRRSNKPDKKFMVNIDGRTIHFGARGMSDYTKHKDSSRKQRYISRHRKRESWSRSGLKSAGFWSKNLLWNKPSLSSSISAVERRYGLKIRRGRA